VNQSLTESIRAHWVIGGMATSLIWFLAGRQSLANKKPNVALGWQSVAVLIILTLVGWTVAEREWVGLTFSTVVLMLELWLIKSTLTARKRNVLG